MIEGLDTVEGIRSENLFVDEIYPAQAIPKTHRVRMRDGTYEVFLQPGERSFSAAWNTRLPFDSDSLRQTANSAFEYSSALTEITRKGAKSAVVILTPKVAQDLSDEIVSGNISALTLVWKRFIGKSTLKFDAWKGIRYEGPIHSSTPRLWEAVARSHEHSDGNPEEAKILGQMMHERAKAILHPQ